MSKKVKQYTYYNPNLRDSNDTSPSQFISGIKPGGGISQLGIQTLPGTKILINTGENNSNETSYITIGQTGIFELDVTNLTPITSVQVLPSSMKNIITNPVGYIIIDTVYEDSSKGGASST